VIFHPVLPILVRLVARMRPRQAAGTGRSRSRASWARAIFQGRGRSRAVGRGARSLYESRRAAGIRAALPNANVAVAGPRAGACSGRYDVTESGGRRFCVVSLLLQIREDIRQRCDEIALARGGWPCRKGCDECCRKLAAAPRITREEWAAIAGAIGELAGDSAARVRERIRASRGMGRPVVCPLLDADSGTCLVYEARPVACRAYGFSMERGEVLGCGRIEAISRESSGVVWGNHEAVEEQLRRLGPAEELAAWLEAAGSG
jgi:Fe-S-cluster containining protein